MNLDPKQFISYFLLMHFFFTFQIVLLSQESLINKPCTSPSEQELLLLLQEIISETQQQGLQIGGIVKGVFSQKKQTDYILWLKEQNNKETPPKRQLFKLICHQSKWKIACKAVLPSGVSLAKNNFVDVTGDGILELIYNFSYTGEQCTDGCAIVSFQKDSIETLYKKQEQNNCQSIDWTLYKAPMDLPFIRYQLSFVEDPTEPYILEKRFIKQYNGGTSQETVLELASIDSSSTRLVYHKSTNQFIVPMKVDCDASLPMDNNIDIKHPAVRLANQHINKNSKTNFRISGVYSAPFSDKSHLDYLLYTNTFQRTNDGPIRRKAIKVVCDGTAWKVAGILYVSANFSKNSIQDVNEDGLYEILDEQIQSEENGCTKTYRILSFQKRVGQLIYSHKNHYTFCTNLIGLRPKEDSEPIGLEYSVRFEDINEDGKKELIQSSSQGQVVFVYDQEQNRYVQLR